MSETALQVLSYNEVKALAADVAKSRLFPAFGNPEQAMVLMMVAQAEGCHPISATQRYDVIQGKPAKKSDAMLADFQRRGGKVTWIELTDKAVEAEFMCNGLSKPVRVRWTMDMANAARLTGKDNWKNYPRAMLRARVVSEGIRISDPGVVAGLYTPEEVQDFAPATSATVTQPVNEAPQTPAPQLTPEPVASKDQIKALCAAMNDIGIKDREDVLATIEKWIGRKVSSRNELTKSEASSCIDSANAVKSQRQAEESQEPGSNG